VTNEALVLKLWKSGAVFTPPASPPDDPLTQGEQAEYEAALKEYPGSFRLPRSRGGQPAAGDFTSMRQVVNNFREWKALRGTPDKLEEVRRQLGMEKQPRTAPAFTDVNRAVSALRKHAALPAALAAQSDPQAIEIRASLAAIGKTVLALEGTARAAAERMLAGSAQRLDTPPAMTDAEKGRMLEELRRQRTALADAARAGLAAEFDAMLATLAQRLDAAGDDQARKTISDWMSRARMGRKLALEFQFGKALDDRRMLAGYFGGNAG
jgi:hypothetical protein